MKQSLARPAARALVFLAALALACPWVFAQDLSIKRTEVLGTDYAGMTGKMAHMAVAEIPPGGQTGKHTHPTPRFVYVLQGSLVLEVEGQPARTFAAGEGFEEMPGTVHNLRNASATVAAKALDFQLADRSQPLQGSATARTPLATMPTKPLGATALAPRQARAGDVDPLDAYRAKRGLEVLANYLPGTWNTVTQEEDQGVSAPMRLRIARLWPERSGEYWYYFEYVDPTDESHALRQRIFQFSSDGVDIHAAMYRVPGDAASYVGEWRKPHPFANVDPKKLREVEGCRTLWQRQMEFIYAAGTEGDSCPGDRPDVRDEHSDFYVTNLSIRTWIRGLDAAGNQVEGLPGPSEFRKAPDKQ